MNDYNRKNALYPDRPETVAHYDNVQRQLEEEGSKFGLVIKKEGVSKGETLVMRIACLTTERLYRTCITSQDIHKFVSKNDHTPQGETSI